MSFENSWGRRSREGVVSERNAALDGHQGQPAGVRGRLEPGRLSSSVLARTELVRAIVEH